MKTKDAVEASSGVDCSEKIHPSDSEIIEGWRMVCETYTPRQLTTTERHQIERAQLAERQAQEKSYDEFILD